MTIQEKEYVVGSEVNLNENEICDHILKDIDRSKWISIYDMQGLIADYDKHFKYNITILLTENNIYTGIILQVEMNVIDDKYVLNQVKVYHVTTNELLELKDYILKKFNIDMIDLNKLIGE